MIGGGAAGAAARGVAALDGARVTQCTRAARTAAGAWARAVSAARGSNGTVTVQLYAAPAGPQRSCGDPSPLSADSGLSTGGAASTPPAANSPARTRPHASSTMEGFIIFFSFSLSFLESSGAFLSATFDWPVLSRTRCSASVLSSAGLASAKVCNVTNSRDAMRSTPWKPLDRGQLGERVRSDNVCQPAAASAPSTIIARTADFHRISAAHQGRPPLLKALAGRRDLSCELAAPA